MCQAAPQFWGRSGAGHGLAHSRGAALRAGHGPHGGTRDGVGHMAAFPGRNRSVLPLDNTGIVNFCSGWEAELGTSCGSGGGRGRGWDGGARPCSWPCFGLCSAPPWPRLLRSSHGCRELMPSPCRDPFPAEGPLSGVKRRMKELISAPQNSSFSRCCSVLWPHSHSSACGEPGGLGVRGTSHLRCLFLHWINGNQIVQPGKSLEAKSCCWSPSRSVELLPWVCLGGKWDVGWDLGSLRLENCHGGGPC